MVYVPVLRRTFPATVAFAIVGCGAGSPIVPTSEPSTRTFCEEVVGVCFEVPADWPEQTNSVGILFSGRSGTDDFFTVLSLQAMTDNGEPLTAILDSTYATFATSRRFQWLTRDPVLVATRPALAYSLELDLDESPRRRAGLLVVGDGLVIDLAYSAVPTLFWKNLLAFEAAAATLTISSGSSSRVPLPAHDTERRGW